MERVLPLAHSQVDWRIFDTTVNEALNKKPSKLLDALRIDPKEHSSFVSVLDLDSDDPLQNLRKYNHTWKHVTMSFMYVLDSDTINEITSRSDLRILVYPVRRDNFIVATGTLEDWYIACLRICRKSSTFEARMFMTQCFELMSQLGYRPIFDAHNRTELDDSTIILRS